MLSAYGDRSDIVVLGLARGGIPVAWEVAAALRAPLDAFIVRKLGALGHKELVFGALASGGGVVVNDDMVRTLKVTPQQLRDVAGAEGRELVRRESAYRVERPPTDVAGKTVILVHDGVATGASMSAAVQAIRESEPAQIVVAVPAAPESTCRELADIVEDVVCATMPTPSWRSGSPSGISLKSAMTKSANSFPCRQRASLLWQVRTNVRQPSLIGDALPVSREGSPSVRLFARR